MTSTATGDDHPPAFGIATVEDECSLDDSEDGRVKEEAQAAWRN
jgi:hypothetical protein